MSGQSIQSVFGEVEAFLQGLCDTGWRQGEAVVLAEKRSSADLFHREAASRPLVVGLFGGTGVGKSSLLNRLADSDVARTGVVRPTSLEITAYLHKSREIDSLPESFSVSNFNCVKHGNDTYRDVMWVDMPDFDSDETQNRDQVLQWIPHIDLLIYVVTPERYKDEQGWQLLMSEGYRHGWLFVINQWDRAQESQMDDFVGLLKNTGFRQPRVFRTVGIDRAAVVDEFEQLASLVAGLAERNAVEQLEQVGWFRRLETARQWLVEQQQILKPGAEPVAEVFARRWEIARQSVSTNLELSFNQFSSKFSESHQSPMKSVISAISGRGSDVSAAEAQSLLRNVDSLWDDWSEVKLTDAITEFELAQGEHGLPPQRLSRLRADIGDIPFGSIGENWGDQIAEVVSNPGPPWQRTLQAMLGWLKILLPVAALGWIAFRVLQGFIGGASDPAAYVGTDLFVNGILLVALSWFLPFIAAYLLRPSVPKAVARSLHEALQRDISRTIAEYRRSLESLVTERDKLRREGSDLQQKIESALSRSSVLSGEDVRELLMHTPG